MKNFLNKFLISIILLLSFTIVYYLNYYNHWSGNLEDFTQVYNSLILNSDYKAEFHDHPGHSLIYLVSLWLEFLKLINILEISSFEELKKVKNLEFELNKVVAFAKMINFVFLSFFLIIFYKHLKNFSKEKNIILIFLLVFICSSPLLFTVNVLKAEFLSAISIFAAFIYLFDSIKKNTVVRKNIFLSGFFFALSLFAKFQSIFVFIFLPLLFLYKKKTKVNFDLIKYENKYLLNLFNTLMILGIFLIYVKYAKGINIIFLPSIFVFFYLLLTLLNKYFINSNYFKIIFSNYFLIGFYACVFFLVILKPFHTNNLSVIVNGLGQASMFIQGDNPYSSDYNSIFKMITKSSENLIIILNLYFFNYFLISLILIFQIILIPFYIISKKFNKLYFIFFTFFIILAICFFFSVRPRPNYMIYLSPIIFSSLFILIKDFNKKYLFSTFIFFLIINSVNVYNYIKVNKYQTSYQRVCVQEFKNRNAYIHWWHKQIDKDFLTRACSKKTSL